MCRPTPTRWRWRARISRPMRRSASIRGRRTRSRSSSRCATCARSSKQIGRRVRRSNRWLPPRNSLPFAWPAGLPRGLHSRARNAICLRSVYLIGVSALLHVWRSERWEQRSRFWRSPRPSWRLARRVGQWRSLTVRRATSIITTAAMRCGRRGMETRHPHRRGHRAMETRYPAQSLVWRPEAARGAASAGPVGAVVGGALGTASGAATGTSNMLLGH